MIFCWSLRPSGLVWSQSLSVSLSVSALPNFFLHFPTPLTERKVPPNFTKKPSESMMDIVGKSVKMEARVSGSQPLTLNWHKDNQEIFNSDKYQVSFQNNLAVLSIQDSSSSDTGLYSCSASNEAGQASCRVSLTVSGMMSLFYCAMADGNGLFISVLAANVLL